MKSGRRTTGSVGVVLACMACTAAAQSQTKPAQPGAKRTPEPSAVVLSDEPFTLDTVGLSLFLPAGARTQSTRAGSQNAVQITPGERDASWLIHLQTPQSKDEQMTIEKVAEEVLNQLLASVAVQTVDKQGLPDRKREQSEGVVLEKDFALTIGPGDAPIRAARFYVRLPGREGQAPVVRGYTVLRSSPGNFITFELMTPEPEFPRVRPLYETTVGTVKLASAGELAAARGAVVERGIALLSRLGAQDYETVIKQRSELWYRLYKPAPGGADADAKELGYRRFRASLGHQGELDTRRGPDKWTAADRQEGYVVRIDGRSLSESGVIDTVAVYFMTPDRLNEGWTLQVAIRDPDRRDPQTWYETGARSGSSMTVSTTGAGAQPTATQPLVPEQGYINQVEQFLLPGLLIQARTAQEFGFYSYQSETGNIRLRRDALEHPEGRADLWQITARINEDRKPQVSLYNEKGELIRTRLPDGSVWEPITLRRLTELWTTKGLPTK